MHFIKGKRIILEKEEGGGKMKIESGALIDGCLCLSVYMFLLEKHMPICHHEDYVSCLSIWKCVH